ncbi:MAG: hypothetical protein AAB425_02520, partial [Bdellovibrionota bacterium]
MRGARMFLELPFLKLRDPKVFEADVANIDQVSDKGLRQFPKMLRNSRFCGAHNRFYRAPAGSPERVFFEKAAKVLNKGQVTIIPEFTDHFPVLARGPVKKSELNGLPRALLTPVEDFIADEKLSNLGRVFHGTPSVENGIAIIRQGLFLSKAGQGAAAFGRGAYSNRDRGIAQAYAGSKGIVFELEIKNDSRINILDWEKHRRDPWLIELAARAAREGRDIHEILSREHGIDVVINRHVLIQNADAFEFPRYLGGLIAGFAQSLARSWHEESQDWINQLQQYTRLHEYGVAMGETDLPSPANLVNELIEHVSAERRALFFRQTLDVPWAQRERLSKGLSWALADPSTEVRRAAGTWFLTNGKGPEMDRVAGPVVLAALDADTSSGDLDLILKRTLPDSPLIGPFLDRMAELKLEVPDSTFAWLINQNFSEDAAEILIKKMFKT